MCAQGYRVELVVIYFPVVVGELHWGMGRARWMQPMVIKGHKMVKDKGQRTKDKEESKRGENAYSTGGLTEQGDNSQRLGQICKARQPRQVPCTAPAHPYAAPSNVSTALNGIIGSEKRPRSLSPTCKQSVLSDHARMPTWEGRGGEEDCTNQPTAHTIEDNRMFQY